MLGVGDVEFLGYEDGELEDTRDLRRDVTREIRRWRPNLIITLNPHRTYNNFPGWHRDHRVTGRVVLDCVYPLARIIWLFRNCLASTSLTAFVRCTSSSGSNRVS